jgi:hypothetical protein
MLAAAETAIEIVRRNPQRLQDIEDELQIDLADFDLKRARTKSQKVRSHDPPGAFWLSPPLGNHYARTLNRLRRSNMCAPPSWSRRPRRFDPPFRAPGAS